MILQTCNKKSKLHGLGYSEALPIIIHFLLESNDISLLESQLPSILRLKVIQSLGRWLGQVGGGGAGGVSVGRGHARVEA